MIPSGFCFFIAYVRALPSYSIDRINSRCGVSRDGGRFVLYACS